MRNLCEVAVLLFQANANYGIWSINFAMDGLRGDLKDFLRGIIFWLNN